MPHAVAGRSGASISGVVLIAGIPTVFRPLPHVAMHVVKTPRICLEAVDRDRLLSILRTGTASICVFGVIIGFER
jgi:hypothetical protein